MALPMFIDWISVRQEYPCGGLPVINDGNVLWLDADGTVERTKLAHMQFDGSYDTRISIRCDGSRVELSGNVGRFSRRDNLFGYDFETCIARCNEVLNLWNLPPFTRGQFNRFADSGWCWTGAVVTRLDLTLNYATGSPQALEAFIKAMAGHHVGRQKGRLSIDGMTVEYGAGSKYVYAKLYCKGAELRKHMKKKAGAHVDADVLDFAERLGTVREEIELKSRFLTQNGLRYLGEITHAKLLEVYMARSQVQRLNEVKFDTFENMPRRLKATYASWKLGMTNDITRATWYRHRTQLLEYGIDISVPCNVHALPIRVRTVELAMLEAPDWYWKKSA